MRNILILAGVTAALAIPTLANAETRCRDSRGNQTAATVVGAIAGGFLGNAVSHGRDRGLATAAGAVGGAVVGNSLASSSYHCPDGYTAYDDAAVSDRYAQPDQYSRDYQPGYPSGYDQPSQGYSYDAYGRKTPAYSSYSQYSQPQTYAQPQAYAQPGYSDRGDGYAAPAPAYSDGQYGDRSYDRGSRSYSQAYSSSSYGDGSATWQDSYGRSCHWRDQTDAYGSHSWVQSCR